MAKLYQRYNRCLRRLRGPQPGHGPVGSADGRQRSALAARPLSDASWM